MYIKGNYALITAATAITFLLMSCAANKNGIQYSNKIINSIKSNTNSFINNSGANTYTSTPSTPSTPDAKTGTIIFEDAAFESIILNILEKTKDNEITMEDLNQIKELRVIGEYYGIDSWDYTKAYNDVFITDPIYGIVSTGDIKTLKDLKYFNNLETLEISYNNIEDDYIPINHMKNLKYLKITRSIINVKNLNFLSGLNNLKTLILNQNRIECSCPPVLLTN